MKSPRIMFTSALAVSSLLPLLVACGGGAIVLEPKVPTEPSSMEPSCGLKVRITKVEDDRTFVDEPEMLKQPSLWDAEPLTTDLSRVIGAKAAQGKVPTNIYLVQGKSVEDIVSDLLAVAFRQAGYTVIEDGDDEADLDVSVTVDQFWLWMTPDAMTIRVESIIQTTVSVKGEGVDQQFNVDGYHDSRDVSKSPDSYAFAMNEGLYDLFTNLATTLIEADLQPVVADDDEI